MPHRAGRLDDPDAKTGIIGQVFDGSPHGKKLRRGDKHLLLQVERGRQPGLPQNSRRPQPEGIECPPDNLAQLALLIRRNVHRKPILIGFRRHDLTGKAVVCPFVWSWFGIHR